jgi:hypothetical protein
MAHHGSFCCAVFAALVSSQIGVLAQIVNTEGLTLLSGTKTLAVTEQAVPTGPYSTFTSKITLAATSNLISGSGGEFTVAGNGTTATESVTYLTGSVSPTSTIIVGGNQTASSSSTKISPVPTNTTPCNNYVEFCDRKYGNITEIAAHNSPFVRKGNSASNQQLDVVTQLNDGVRFLQAQMRWPTNGTQPHFCHTSCDILDAGPITQWLGKVKDWVASHPYDVVTILLGNGNYSAPSYYAPYIESTGLLQYAYTPPFLPMALGDWPTLTEMILTGKRVVIFMDYMADQLAYPWLLDQFSQMWETPFNPMDRNFPCTVQRPPNLGAPEAKNRLYLMNHNLNAEFNVFGASILVPAVALLNETNNATGFGSLGVAASGCTADWGRPPNFLNVDYYNFGGYPGSVFEVAAKMNNVTYNRECCGKVTSGAPSLRSTGGLVFLTIFMAISAILTNELL